MSQYAIEVVDVWKKFHRGALHDSLRDLIPAVAKRMVGRGPKPTELEKGDFWALKDVAFRVKPGEALGIIGPNGAGKSTMLKILTKILRPTRGTCTVRGRVGALIEVAAGFHPDLTGMENIFLQGAIMGMRSSEIALKVDEIVAFAGVADFIDTPVKRYSSGMHARLGFSVAAHLNPDVLLIDEVLSVGDMAFQERCIDRMKQFKQQGVAIAFVSHNMQAVAELCDTGVFLAGTIREIGPANDAIGSYVRSASQQTASPKGAAIDILKAELLDESGRSVVSVNPGDAMTLRVGYRVQRPMKDFHFRFILLRSTDGLKVFDGNLRSEELGLDGVTAGEQFSVDFRFRAHLVRGQYHIATHVFDNPTHASISHLVPAGLFAVRETRTYGGGVADVELTSGGVSRAAPTSA
ncbi:MAG TPA: ABC transporter ATP-binding protein [Candidatus Eisenbacteria bacterium]|nr:ABC transporter ATP-binding protein [Candidatus Eisenbacteria bacterium]